jgi:hypothetical protein
MRSSLAILALAARIISAANSTDSYTVLVDLTTTAAIAAPTKAPAVFITNPWLADYVLGVIIQCPTVSPTNLDTDVPVKFNLDSSREKNVSETRLFTILSLHALLV